MNPMEQLEARDDVVRLCPLFENAVEHYEKVRLGWFYRVEASGHVKDLRALLQNPTATYSLLSCEKSEIENFTAAAYDFEYAAKKLSDAEQTVDVLRQIKNKMIEYRMVMNTLNNLHSDNDKPA